MIRLLSHVLFRAPLLPLAALARPARESARLPMLRAAIAHASPSLAAAAASDRAADRARLRYARRAAFRPTPSGLLAGVFPGTLGARTRLTLAGTHAHLTPSYAALAAHAVQLLDDPDLRVQTRLRVAPSLVHHGDRVRWLAAGDEPQAVRGECALDAMLDAVLTAAATWTPWPDVVTAARAMDTASDDERADELLVGLVHIGLLVSDLAPPLIGPPPAEWMSRRLAALAPARTLPTGLATHAVLLHTPRGQATLSFTAAERAAAIAPLLFRLQHALAPPACERDLDPRVGEAVAAIAEIFGAGAYPLAALARVDYGLALPTDDAPPHSPAPPPALLARLVDGLLAPSTVLALDPDELDALLPPAPPPPSFELFLTPAREPRGAPPGTDWLLGLHAPAGASLGRFAHALGDDGQLALDDLAAAERALRPGEEALDLAFAPSAATGDLAAHPPVRARTLALTSWPEDDARTLTLADLALAVPDDGGPWSLTTSSTAGDAVVTPSPLTRLRSTTAPAGVDRLLVGARLVRQHHPWALHLGPLADLVHLPRITIDGFVVMPASWRVPSLSGPAALRRWRKDARVPRQLQVGHEDELLFVDLDDRHAHEELARHLGARAWEVWPPLDRTPSTHRVEAIVAAIVEVKVDGEPPRPAPPIVPPPRLLAAAPGWRTFKLFGDAERAPWVLATFVGPLVRAARASGELSAWFFQRYVDGPGRREHLRLRVRAATSAGLDRFARALDRALGPACDDGAIVTIETAPYFPEHARLGDAVEDLFEADSELCLDHFLRFMHPPDSDDAPPPPDDESTLLLVRGFDALAASLGRDLAARAALATRLRARRTEPHDVADLARDYRAAAAHLQAALRGDTPDAAAPAIAAYRARLAMPRAHLSDHTLATLLHLCAVRLAGPAPELETRAIIFWQRSLEGLLARTKSPARPEHPPRQPRAPRQPRR